MLDPSKKKKVEPKAKGKASRRKPTVEIGEQMNSDDEEILDYSSESDSDSEEDVDKNDSKEEGKGKKKNNGLEKGRLEVRSKFNNWHLILWPQTFPAILQ